MYSDFHYGVIKVLARAAGFDEDDAQVIAYASQYTDNAANHQLVIVDEIDTLGLNRRLKGWMSLMGMGTDPERVLVKRMYGRWCFDPICTAHEGLDYILGPDPDVQRKVYVPFHFIPATEFVDGEDFSFLTRPGSAQAREFLSRVLDAYRQDDGDQKKYRQVALCALGCALHTYADTWAHEGFSGRWSSMDNNAGDLTVDGAEPPMDFKIQAGKLIQIGHLDVSGYVDQTFGDIKFTFDRGDSIERNNTDHFKVACKSILDQLAPLNGVNPTIAWDKVQPPLDGCLRPPMDTGRRKACLQDAFAPEFPGLEMAYHKMWWEWNAVKMKPAWDTPEGIVYELHKDETWFDFHVAAATQRMYVRRRLPAS